MRLLKKFKCKSYEIIYVDDDSTDKTQSEILSLKKQEKNVRYIFRKKKSFYSILGDENFKRTVRCINGC